MVGCPDGLGHRAAAAPAGGRLFGVGSEARLAVGTSLVLFLVPLSAVDPGGGLRAELAAELLPGLHSGTRLRTFESDILPLVRRFESPKACARMKPRKK